VLRQRREDDLGLRRGASAGICDLAVNEVGLAPTSMVAHGMIRYDPNEAAGY